MSKAYGITCKYPNCTKESVRNKYCEDHFIVKKTSNIPCAKQVIEKDGTKRNCKRMALIGSKYCAWHDIKS